LHPHSYTSPRGKACYCPGRSSGSQGPEPTPRAFPSFASCVRRVPCVIATDATTRHALDVSRVQTVASAGFVPIHSGGAATVFHPLPFARRHYFRKPTL